MGVVISHPPTPTPLPIPDHQESGDVINPRMPEAGFLQAITHHHGPASGPRGSGVGSAQVAVPWTERADWGVVESSHENRGDWTETARSEIVWCRY